MNYRNKTIFDWNDFQSNNISSITSLNIMNFLKRNINMDIKNIIIRDIENQVGIIIQINNIINKDEGFYVFNLLDKLNYELKFFGIQMKCGKIFIKNKNIIVYKNDFLSFSVNYVDKKIIKLLPDSFYQSNISVLNEYYDNFKLWIKKSGCKNMINIGDDGGNICIILSSLFEEMVSYFHCSSSYMCAEEMIKANKIKNLKLTYNLFDLNLDDVILFINPGRKGLTKNELNYIKKSDIKYVIYMACNNNSFLKDLDELKFKILDKDCILSMPGINKYQYLYFLN